MASKSNTSGWFPIHWKVNCWAQDQKRVRLFWWWWFHPGSGYRVSSLSHSTWLTINFHTMSLQRQRQLSVGPSAFSKCWSLAIDFLWNGCLVASSLPKPFFSKAAIWSSKVMAEISRQDLKVIAVIQISYILHIYSLSMVQILFYLHNFIKE